MSFWESVGQGVGDFAKKEYDRKKKELSSQLRAMSDAEVRHAADNARTPLARDLAQEEAQRRGI